MQISFLYILYVTLSSPDSWLYLLKFDTILMTANKDLSKYGHFSDNNATKHHVLMKS